MHVRIYTVERSAWHRKGAATRVRNRIDRQAGKQANDLRPVAPDAQPETQARAPAQPNLAGRANCRTANCRTEPIRVEIVLYRMVKLFIVI
jgi:hypothetical protein